MPTNIALEDDSTDPTVGSLLVDQIAELVKDDDRFGTSMAMSRDGMTLVIGCPESDGQYFTNFRGTWNLYQQYNKLDVVKHNGSYFELSVSTSVNQTPGIGAGLTAWRNVGDVAAGAVTQNGNFIIGRIHNIAEKNSVSPWRGSNPRPSD